MDRYVSETRNGNARAFYFLRRLKEEGKSEEQIQAEMMEELGAAYRDVKMSEAVCMDHDNSYQKQIREIVAERDKYAEAVRHAIDVLQKEGYWAPENKDDVNIGFWIMGMAAEMERLREKEKEA